MFRGAGGAGALQVGDGVRTMRARLPGNPRDCSHYASHLEENIVGHPAQIRYLPDSPIEASHVFAKNYTVDFQARRQNHLKLIALHLARNGAGKGY
jgi:hypothetical protein